ncbi:hypothetical protein MCUN1_000163 [Malassezia cuniculi]|uniref:Autophagy-related protein 8 n=1 Tax=Malassezia cuniculi TaxID=948313 RepID=A0AAF0EQQ3_9BASI|nr:hypothetical protein MCUN1_000163 [Malassezia cuniculi]
MRSAFKKEHSFEERRQEAERIRSKYPDRIPVICEKAPKTDVPTIDKNKFLVPSVRSQHADQDLSVGQFVYVVRKRIKLAPEKAIFIFVADILPATAAQMSTIYEQHKDADGFLYVKYVPTRMLANQLFWRKHIGPGSPSREGVLSASFAARISSPLAELSLETVEAPIIDHLNDNAPVDSVWPTQDEHESSGSESPPKVKSNIGMPPRSGYSLSDDSDSLRSEGDGSTGSGFSSTDSGSDNDDGNADEDDEQDDDRLARWKEQCAGIWEGDKEDESPHVPHQFEEEDDDTSNDADAEDESAAQDSAADGENSLSPALDLIGDADDEVTDDGLSSLERTFLFAKSDMAYHRILVSRCLADWIHEVDLTDAVEYVIPLLNGLGTDEIEVSAAFAPELGRLMWFFFRNCPLAELAHDSPEAPQEDSSEEHIPRPRLPVGVFSPLLCALLLNPNSAVSGATQASIVEYFLHSKQYDEDGDAELVTHGTGREGEQVPLEPYTFGEKAREAVLNELFDNVTLAISRLDDDEHHDDTDEARWPDGDESSIAEAYALEAGTYDEESALGRMMAVNLLAAITVEGGFSNERLATRVIPELIPWTQDKAFFVRKEVAAAIGIIGKALVQQSDGDLPDVSGDLLKALHCVLEDRVWQVRQAACYSLPGIFSTLPVNEARRNELVSAMKALQADISQNVQLAAFEMIGEVIYLFHKDPQGVPEELIRLFLGQPMDGGEQPVDTDEHLADPDRALIVAFNLPAVALTLGPEYWDTLRGLYNDLAVHVFDNVRNSVAASLHEMARLLGPEIAAADILPVATNLLHDPSIGVSATLLEHIDVFLDVLPVDLAKAQLQLMSMLWFTQDPRDWRLRQRIAQHVETLVPRLLLADEEGCLVTVLHLALHSPVFAVRQVGIRAATRVYATFLEHDAVVADGFLGMLGDMADVATYRQRVTFLRVVAALVEQNVVPSARFEALLLPRLTVLADDHVYEVRVALAHVVRVVFESTLYPDTPPVDLVHILAHEDENVFAFAPPALVMGSYAPRTDAGRRTPPMDVPQEEADAWTEDQFYRTSVDFANSARALYPDAPPQYPQQVETLGPELIPLREVHRSRISRGSVMTVPQSEPDTDNRSLFSEIMLDAGVKRRSSEEAPLNSTIKSQNMMNMTNGSMLPLHYADKSSDELASSMPDDDPIEEEEDSPYMEVRASVSNIDDPTMPVITFRMMFLGLLLSVFGGALNIFFSFRYPSPSISPMVLQIIAYPMGKFMAYILPIRTFHLPRWLGGFSFTLNPGYFNIKEHTMITVMINITILQAYSLNYLVVHDSPAFYGLPPDEVFDVFFTLGSQIIGFGLSGILAYYLVYPAKMIWPQTLVITTVLNALHAEPDKEENSISRFRWFLIIGVAAFCYNFLPSFLFLALSQFCWLCWIMPNNRIVNIVMGTSNGMGLSLFAFDWSQISYICSPLVAPWWAECNMMFGFVLMTWIIAPSLYFSNSWDLGFMPFSSNSAYDNRGQKYQIMRVINTETNTFDEASYNSYSPMYLSVSYVMSYFCGLACITAVLMHTTLYHGKDIYNIIRSVKTEKDDIHAKLMRRYKPVPQWWYSAVITICLIVLITVTQTGSHKFGFGPLILSLLIPVIYALPSGYLFAITYQMIGTNLVSELIAGYLLPNRANELLIFKTLAVQTLMSSLNFTADLKLGHYMKVPPRVTFLIQIFGTIVVVLVQIGIKRLMFITVEDLCMPSQASTSKFTCPHMAVFYTSSLIWGVVGPQRIFSIGARYSPLLISLAIGLVLPIPVWYLARRFPQSIFKYVNVPVIFFGVTLMPGAGGINFSSWFIVAFIFQFLLRRFKYPWWFKYNFATSAALESGTVISVVLIFLVLQLPLKNYPRWWGNEVVKSTMDFRGVSLKDIPSGGLGAQQSFDLSPM